jgi:hypothetical protein
MQYKVIPFVANISPGDNAGTAAGQLAALINREGADGWEYLRMESLEININDPGTEGCFGFGSTPPTHQVTRYDMVVFRHV